MTWPFENDTSAITKKLAKKSLQSEKRRNLMVVIAVALAAFLICFTGIVSTSLTQMQRNQVVDTYEAVWLGVEENDIETLKGLPEFERVGGYYMLGEELSEQGYHASYVYCDTQMMEITKAQMELLEGRVPEKANEIVVSKYFLSTYGNNAKIGDTVTLDTESFHGDYVVTGIMNSVNEKEANTCAIILSKAALTEWNGFDPAGYRAYAHFKNSDQLGEELMTSYCREIAEEYQLPMPKMNSKYFAYASKSFDFALMAGVIALVLIGGYIVIQSIFRISINDKIQSYGQLRTIGATPKQIKRIVKNEGRKLGSIGILIGTVLGVCGGFLLFSKGFNAVSYVATVILTLISSWIMVSVSIRKPVKIAAGISPIEAVHFTPAQKDIRSRKKNIKLNPVSMGIANFRRDRKKTVAIVASLSLGGIILLVVSSIVLLRSPEALARQFFPDGQTVLPIVGSRDIAEDIVADTFLILLAKINSVMEHEQPVKWLFRVLKNNAISEYRAQCRHAAAPLEESILRAAEPELIPFSGMLPKGLSASEQRILTLRLAEDMDYSTISEKLGISETACRSQYSRARRHCAELMERSDDNAGF